MPSKKSIFNQKGFTLIELVIAIAIIGALSGVLTFVINPEKQKNRASDAVIMSSLIKSKLSAEAYINSYGRYPNEEEFFNSISKNGKQRNDNACEISGLPDNECLFNIDGVDTPETCDEDGWFGDPNDLNKCFFRYKGGIDGEKDRYRVSVKTHGLVNRVLIFDNKLDGNIYECPWPLTDNLDFEDCNVFGIEKKIEQAQGWGWGLFGGGGDDEDDDETVQGVTPLKLTSVCSNDPDTIRKWRVKNTNPFEVEVFWNVVGTTQSGDFMTPASGNGFPKYPDAQDGDDYTFFETNTVGGANTTKIWWYDLDNVKHETVKASGGEVCELPYTCDESSLDISTDSMPNADYGEYYSTTFLGTGGEQPYSWNILWEDSTLPGEFILHESSGTLSGTPYGHHLPYPLSIRVTDDKECSVDKAFSLTVDREYDCSTTDLYVVSTSIPEATSGESYSTQVYASGGMAPYTWEIVEEETTVPGYLTIDQSWGSITGTPEGEEGFFTLTVKVSDSSDCFVKKSFTIYINAEEGGDILEIPTYYLPIATEAAPYFFKFEGIGGAEPYTWNFNPDEPVESHGFSIDAEDATISGTPAYAYSSPHYMNQSTVFPINVTLTDAHGATATVRVYLRLEDQYCSGLQYVVHSDKPIMMPNVKYSEWPGFNVYGHIYSNYCRSLPGWTNICIDKAHEWWNSSGTYWKFGRSDGALYEEHYYTRTRIKKITDLPVIEPTECGKRVIIRVLDGEVSFETTDRSPLFMLNSVGNEPDNIAEYNRIKEYSHEIGDY
ncbi:putative Ig domain-containing protein [Patescibacteria group bacterium]